MVNEAITALGPVFGPDFVLIVVNDDTNKQYHLQVYPDANNPLLKANGLATQYYFLPERVYLAKKQFAPSDFDFGMTIFKGLMTSETTLGITATTGGTAEAGGGFCSFSTTFAIPDSVVDHALQKLKNKDHPAPVGRIANFFNYERNDLDPLLGIVSIVDNNVTIEIPSLQIAGGPNVPFMISAQGTGKGSIGSSGISTFLVTCNQMAAGAIAGSLKNGMSPFTVHYNLKQQFYINACDIHVDVDVDKVFNQFSGALSAGSILGIDSLALSANYQSCVTSGAIKTIMRMDNANIPDDLKKMIETQCEEMRKQAFDLVKKEIFDWTPTPDAPATTDRGFFSSLFGGSSVSLKFNYQHRGVHLSNDFTLDSTIVRENTVSGDLNDLQPAIVANLNKYLAIIDIGEYFRKIQIAATNNINWSEKPSDGTDLADPIISAQIEMSYPDFSTPVDANHHLNLRTQANGFHYTIAQHDTNHDGELAFWSAENPRDIINISALRLDKLVPEWDADQVKIRKTIVFNGSDPRVELASGGTTYVKEEITTRHAPVITSEEVGYIFVKFLLDRILPKDNITLTLTCMLGGRKDTLTITRATQKNILWEIFSDKYIGQTSFQYDLQVEVVGPDFTDDPATYGTPAPITVPLPTGRVKYVNPFKLVLPQVPPTLINTVNTYIRNYPTS
ncbi:MAG TPA: hypothetical protein VL485_01385 [Ktedonobacteraceae bacterium]|jgi:hypothetical protein|nr:hypothetical protein [Ktedonobacteraceae bacterium]